MFSAVQKTKPQAAWLPRRVRRVGDTPQDLLRYFVSKANKMAKRCTDPVRVATSASKLRVVTRTRILPFASRKSHGHIPYVRLNNLSGCRESNSGLTIRYLRIPRKHPVLPIHSAFGVGRIELPSHEPESCILPLYYTPKPE